MALLIAEAFDSKNVRFMSIRLSSFEINQLSKTKLQEISDLQLMVYTSCQVLKLLAIFSRLILSFPLFDDNAALSHFSNLTLLNSNHHNGQLLND